MLKDFAVIRLFLRFILPYILLYASYIQLNGELSPGGGFQAGAIFAVAIIGYDLIFGYDLFSQKFSVNILMVGGITGVLIYAMVGVISLFRGGNFLNYNLLLQNKLAAQHFGIFAIEIGVGVTVASIMCLIYLLLRVEKMTEGKKRAKHSDQSLSLNEEKN